MLNSNETVLWRRLERLEEKIAFMEDYMAQLATKFEHLDVNFRARLKEEADAARM